MLKDSWLFPVAESVHLTGIALMVGAIILADLRTLGYSGRGVSAFWTALGFALIVITGPLLFLSDVPRYLNNPAFLVKLVFLLLAAGSHFTLHRKQTRTTALLSVILWSCVVLSGRAIADFDV
jgi:hypothetical protein